MWGPVGLLLSTPLTLCLVVAGRHLRGLEPVTILLGDAPNISGAQRFYQRVLASDTNTILSDAYAYLRRSSFARYCDQVLLPGLGLASADYRDGKIDAAQVAAIRAIVATVATTLTPESGPPERVRRRRDVALLDTSLGAHLRQMRLERHGRWQGSLDVPSHSVVLCAALPAERDEALSELLVRALREARIDARSTIIDPREPSPGPDRPDLLSTVILPYPVDESLELWLAMADELHARQPDALLAALRLADERSTVPVALVEKHVDIVLRSFEEALAFVAPERGAKGGKADGAA
jgi:hypothetical protein